MSKMLLKTIADIPYARYRLYALGGVLNTTDISIANEVLKRYNFIEANGGLDEVERKLKYVNELPDYWQYTDKIKAVLDKRLTGVPLGVGMMEVIMHEIAQILIYTKKPTPPPRLTVGELKPGDRFRVTHRVSSRIYEVVEMDDGHLPAKGHVFVFNDGHILSFGVSTPCEIVEKQP